MSRRKRLRPDEQVAWNLRCEFQDRGLFNNNDYLAELAIALERFRDQAYHRYVLYTARKVDIEAARRVADDQPSLLPGWDLEGELRLGNGQRVTTASALIEHGMRVMDLAHANLVRCARSNATRRRGMEMIRPYWSVPGRSMNEAIELYRADHPEE